MIPRSTRRLSDEILAEACSRGVPLEAERLALEQDLPVLRLRVGDQVLHRTRVRLPGLPGVSGYAPDVITVHGWWFRSSRTWPRKRDGTFAIGAVVDRLLALVDRELGRPPPDVHVARVPPAASGLHVVHAAAVLLGTLTADTTADDLVGRLPDEEDRARVDVQTRRGGLTDGIIRRLSDVAGLLFGRAVKVDDFDPLELISDDIVVMLRLGQLQGGRVERRFVLLLDRRGDQVTLADPGGDGMVTMSRGAVEASWQFGRTRGAPWMGTVSRWDR